MKRFIILLLAIPLLFAGCEKLFEPYEKRTYWNTEGVGYVCNIETKEPVPNAIISISNGFEQRHFGTVQPVHELFEADAQGYFRIKFLKRYHKSNVVGYTISARNADNNPSSSPIINLKVDDIKGQNILNLDTLWVR